MRFIIGNIIQANKMFKMIKNNDRIAIGLSGGKDSFVLWKALSLYCDKLHKQLGWNITLKAFHVKLDFVKTDYSKLIEYANKNKLDLEILDSKITEILKAKTNNGKIQCSLCSKMKKAVLIDTLKEQNFKILAFGHHADDTVETLLMNMLNEGRMSVFQPSTYLDRNDITLIRPMVLCREKQIIKVCKKLELPIITEVCPNERTTQRTNIKKFIQKEFYDSKTWPNSYENLMNSLLNGHLCSLWFNNGKKGKNLSKIALKSKTIF